MNAQKWQLEAVENNLREEIKKLEEKLKRLEQQLISTAAQIMQTIERNRHD